MSSLLCLSIASLLIGALIGVIGAGLRLCREHQDPWGVRRRTRTEAVIWPNETTVEASRSGRRPRGEMRRRSCRSNSG
jgi:hypothetical protein